MDNKIENKNSKYLNDTIVRYPFNGRSKYLIDKFYIMGYDSKTLYKNLIDNNYDDIINKSNSSLNISLEDLFAKAEIKTKKYPQVFHIEESPTILNEITSDYKKQVPDKDLIKDMIFPNKIDFYYTEEITKIKSFYSEENSYRMGSRQTSLYSKLSGYTINDSKDNKEEEFINIFIEDDNIKFNSKYIKPYNIIFSYNPQTGTNSKKSINGFAHVFYRKYYQSKNMGDKIISFYVPIIFCIISEFPFYNSFYSLCNQIKNLYKEKNEKNECNISVPLEILIYNIINFTLSPLNNDIFLFIEPVKFPTEKMEIKDFPQKNKNSSGIKEIDEENLEKKENIFEQEIIEEIEEDEKVNKEQKTKKILKKEEKTKKLNKKVGFSSKTNNKKEEYNNYKIKNVNILNTTGSDDNIFEDLYEYTSEENINNEISSNKNNKSNKNMRKSLSQNKFDSKSIKSQKKYNKDKNKINYNNKFSSYSRITTFKSTELNNSSSNLNKIINEKLYNNIKFSFLPGYPLIQYNLVKVLLNILSPQDVIIIFFHTFLEKDVVFFSKDIEYLSLTIDAYLNLNFPLNDEKYYFFNACVSYENYINNNSTFVGSTFTSILGVNSPYLPEYKNTEMSKSKEHLCVDLDNGNLHFMKDKSTKIFNSQNADIFLFIKKICKSKDYKDETILCREIKILNEKLSSYKNKLNSKNNIDFYSNISKCDYIDYNEGDINPKINIKKINKEIQESFYRLINNLCLYFYQNLSLKDEISEPKKKEKNKIPIKSSIRQSLRKSKDEEKLSIIFKKDYLFDDENSIYTKEELSFLNELTDTMKFESFVYGFIQSYNPIDLYKIPLTFTEEFLSILSRKNINLKNFNFNFLSLIDSLYEGNAKKDLYVDLNPFLSVYFKKYKNYFDREIYDIYYKNKNININSSVIGINFIKDNDNNLIINDYKYKSYELDKNILLKYRNFINNLSKEEYYHIFYLSNILEKNDIKNILLTDIENGIEKYLIDIGLLSINDVCCSNIILLFILSLKDIMDRENIDCAGFLYSLVHTFIVFRKYYTMIMNSIYQLMKNNLNNDNYNLAKKYYYCYLPCINSLRNVGLVPNENLMNIINKFNSIKIDALLEKEDKKDENNTINKNSQNELILNYDSKYVHLSYNYDKSKFYKVKEVIEKINPSKDNKLNIDNENQTRKFEPKIVYNDGKFNYKCNIISQAKILEILTQQYNILYNNEFDESKLNIDEIFNMCLNIDLFIKSSEIFKDITYIRYCLQCIYDLYLNKLNKQKKI